MLLVLAAEVVGGVDLWRWTPASVQLVEAG